MPTVFSTADVAKLMGVPRWKVARLFEEGTIPEPTRLGNQRAIPRELIPTISTALSNRGWLPAGTAVEATPEVAQA